MCLQALFYYCAMMLLSFVDGFSLSSSPSSEDGHVRVCPGTTVTLTCTASQVRILTWLQEPNQELHPFFPDDYETEGNRVVVEGPYTLTLVAVTNVSGTTADFTSTLETMVDDVEDGTSITCDVLSDKSHLTISKIASPPSPPANVMIVLTDYHTHNFSIIISWDEESGEVVDEYRILTNTSDHFISTNTTTVVVEGEYNIPLQITLLAINCAGSSAEVTEQLIVAGCAPPSPPVNGSVGEWTSSRVGAQVSYSCDTDLVLVGERLATCSCSLQWLPTSNDVMCIDPGSTTTPNTPPTTILMHTPSQSGERGGSSLSTAEAVATTAVVCVVCSFTAGLLLGVLLTQCHVHCHRKQKRGQTEIPPVYEDIPLEKKPAIELHSNEAYGHVSH